MTDTNTYTWTPAEKLGRELRFGDVVRRWNLPESEADRVLVQHGQYAHTFPEGGDPEADIEEYYVAHLLVRQPLSESTDEAFRRGAEAGYNTALDVLQFYRDQIEDHDASMVVHGVLCAVAGERDKAINESAIPTPTEADDEQ